MTMDRANNSFLRVIIPILVLADGVIHFSLDFVLFRGRLIGSPFQAGAGRPAGATPRPGPLPGPRLSFPLPLNEMFLLNFVGALILATLFIAGRGWSQARRVLLDVVIIGYVAFTFVAWWLFGRPNPMGLGYLSKGIEIVLVIALLAHIWSMLRTRNVAGTAVTTGA